VYDSCAGNLIFVLPPWHDRETLFFARAAGDSQVMVAPMGGFGYSPFGYSPFGGLGTGYALGAMSGNNGGNQQVRQETYRLENQVKRRSLSEQRKQK